MQTQSQERSLFDMSTTNHIDFRIFKDNSELSLADYEMDFKLRYWTINYKKIRQYINGDFSHSIPIRMMFPDYKLIQSRVEDIYIHSVLVLNEDDVHPEPIRRLEDNWYYEIDGALKLPLELWLLQLIETGLYELLVQSGYNFDDQIAMFEAEQVGSISDEKLKEMCQFGLLSSDYEAIDHRIKTTQKVLQRCPIVKPKIIV